jgi:hypothetical protein
MNRWKWGLVVSVSCAVFTFTAQRVAAFTGDYHAHKEQNAADMATLRAELESIDQKLGLILRICPPRER